MFTKFTEYAVLYYKYIYENETNVSKKRAVFRYFHSDLSSLPNLFSAIKSEPVDYKRPPSVRPSVVVGISVYVLFAVCPYAGNVQRRCIFVSV